MKIHSAIAYHALKTHADNSKTLRKWMYLFNPRMTLLAQRCMVNRILTDNGLPLLGQSDEFQEREHARCE